MFPGESEVVLTIVQVLARSTWYHQQSQQHKRPLDRRLTSSTKLPSAPVGVRWLPLSCGRHTDSGSVPIPWNCANPNYAGRLERQGQVLADRHRTDILHYDIDNTWLSWHPPKRLLHYVYCSSMRHCCSEFGYHSALRIFEKVIRRASFEVNDWLNESKDILAATKF